MNLESELCFLKEYYEKLKREEEDLEDKYKGQLDIPASMCDRLYYPTEVIHNSVECIKTIFRIREIENLLKGDKK